MHVTRDAQGRPAHNHNQQLTRMLTLRHRPRRPTPDLIAADDGGRRFLIRSDHRSIKTLPRLAMADDAPQHQQQEQEVARVLRARHAFDVLQLAVREHEEADVKRWVTRGIIRRFVGGGARLRRDEPNDFIYRYHYHQSHITPYNRAYRRLALLLHPDKNSHEGAVALLLGGGNLSRMIR